MVKFIFWQSIIKILYADDFEWTMNMWRTSWSWYRRLVEIIKLIHYPAAVANYFKKYFVVSCRATRKKNLNAGGRCPFPLMVAKRNWWSHALCNFVTHNTELKHHGSDASDALDGVCLMLWIGLQRETIIVTAWAGPRWVKCQF